MVSEIFSSGFFCLFVPILFISFILLFGRHRSAPLDEFEEINKEIENLYKLLESSRDKFEIYLRNSKYDNSIKIGSSPDWKIYQKLVATDVFVEKAQFKLTQRAELSLKLAKSCLALCAAIAGGFLWWVSAGPLADPALLPKPGESAYWIYVILRTLTVGAVFLAGIYITSSLAKGFLSEWSMLMNRRHALRFGRLTVYLKDAKVSVEELTDAFGWNLNPQSNFRSFSPEHVTKGIIGQMTGAAKDLADASVSIVKAAKTKDP